MRNILFLGTLVLLAACSERPPAPAASVPAASAPAAAPAATAPATRVEAAQANLLRAEGVGPVRFGMRLDEAERIAGKAERPTPFDPACSMLRFPQLPGLRFMVESGTVTRADADPGVANAMGIAVGDTLEQVRAAHPEAELGKHKYAADGHYLSFPSADRGAALVLEAVGGRITKIRAGTQPAVSYVETCG